jgi:hypothetical protein
MENDVFFSYGKWQSLLHKIEGLGRGWAPGAIQLILYKPFRPRTVYE